MSARKVIEVAITPEVEALAARPYRLVIWRSSLRRDSTALSGPFRKATHTISQEIRRRREVASRVRRH